MATINIATLGVNTSFSPHGLTSGLARAQGAVQSAGAGIGNAARGITGALGGIAGRMATFAGGLLMAKAAQAVTTGFFDMAIGANAFQERMRVSWTVMLGSEQRANSLFNQLQEFANVTPFELPGLAASTSRLLAYGFAADEVLPMLQVLGDAAAASPIGMQEGLDRITLAIGQMRGAGRVNAQDMRQLTEVGIASWDMLATHVGVSQAQIREMVTRGEISSEVGIAAIMGGIGNRFRGMMAQQSQSYDGLLSTFRDNVKMKGAEAFKPIFDSAKLWLGRAINFMNSAAGKEFFTNFKAGVAGILSGFKAIGEVVGGILGPAFTTARDLLKLALGQKVGKEAEHGQQTGMSISEFGRITYGALAGLGGIAAFTASEVARVGSAALGGVPAFDALQQGTRLVSDNLEAIYIRAQILAEHPIAPGIESVTPDMVFDPTAWGGAGMVREAGLDTAIERFGFVGVARQFAGNAQIVQNVLNRLRGMQIQDPAMAGMLQQQIDQINALHAAANPAAAAIAQLNAAQGALRDDIAEFTVGLEKNAATFGMSREETALWEFSQKGATEAMLAGARAAIEMNRAAELTSKARTQFQTTSETISELYNSWMWEASISDEVFGFHLNHILDGFAQIEDNAPGALLEGSAGAVSAINRFQRQQQQREDPATRMARILEQMRLQGEAQLERAREIAQAIRDNRPLLANIPGVN